jgi:TrmH family RNA methyltransferase
MITSTSNERVKWIRSLQARRRNRDSERRFVAEGVRWAEEFIGAQRTPELVLHTEELDQRERTALGRLTAMGAQELLVSPEVMAACSDTESPQRLLLVAAQPEISPPSPSDWLLVADGLSDPGNLGTLLRTALAAGVDALLLVKGSVDPYNPKVVRAAMGYTGSASLADLQERAEFIRVSGAGVREGHVHDVDVTREAPNYLRRG